MLSRLKKDVRTVHSGMKLMYDKLEMIAQQTVVPMLDSSTSVTPIPITGRFKNITPRTSTPKIQYRRVTFSPLPAMR